MTNFPTKGPQHADILVGPTPANARRLIVVDKIYIGDVRKSLAPGQFIDVIPNEYWKYEGKPYKEFGSLGLALKSGFIEPYNPRDPMHHQLVNGQYGDDNQPDERGLSKEEMEDLFSAAPTVQELESGQFQQRPRTSPAQRMSQQASQEPGSHHVAQTQASETVAVGVDRYGNPKKMDEYDPAQGRPDLRPEALDPAEWAHPNHTNVAQAQESRPQLRGKNATARLAQNLATAKMPETIEGKRMASDRNMLQNNAAMPVVGAEITTAASISDGPEPEGLKNLTVVKGGTQTVGVTQPKTQVIRNAVDAPQTQVTPTVLRSNARQRWGRPGSK